MVNSQPFSVGFHQAVTLCGFPFNSVAHAYPLLTDHSISNNLSHYSSSGPTFISPAVSSLGSGALGSSQDPVSC